MNKKRSSNPKELSCDILVVGYGAAGACAALEAHSRKGDVLIIDAGGSGGASAISGGVYYAGAGTSLQKNLHVEDTPKAMEAYLSREVKDAVDQKTLTNFCEQSVHNFDWLCGHGVRFGGKLYPSKISYPPAGIGLYYSGNEENFHHDKESTAVPRGHVPQSPPFSLLKGLGAGQFFNPLDRSVKKNKIPIMTCCRGEDLLKEDGVITGIKAMAIPKGLKCSIAAWSMRWSSRLRFRLPPASRLLRILGKKLFRKYARPLTIYAKKAVIITTGGFIFNRDMVQKYAPAYRACLPLGTPFCDGSGITMAEEKGAKTKRMDKVSAWRFINPPRPWTYGMIVGPNGQRMCDESLYGSYIGGIMCEQHGGKGYIILDDRLAKQALKDLVPWRTRFIQYIPALLTWFIHTHKAGSIQSLARRIKVDPDTLATTLQRYNTNVDGGVDTQFSKAPKNMRALLEPPFYAVDISVTSRTLPCAAITLGGLDVEGHTGRVRDDDGNVIEHLYAAGRAAVGVASENYVTGLSLADCVFSGRRAGKHAIASSISAAVVDPVKKESNKSSSLKKTMSRKSPSKNVEAEKVKVKKSSSRKKKVVKK